jgi:segregation and condensation protein A
MNGFAHDAIALLIDLAQRGELDPWDVQVVDVLDRFLSELSFQDARELSSSGQAFLYASMFLLLKADTLAATEIAMEEPEELEHLTWGDDEVMATGLPPKLEDCLQRRPVARPPLRRRVTLPELIHQLELMAEAAERQTQRPRTRKKTRPSKAQSLKVISQLAHQENLTEVAAELEQLLAQLGHPQVWLDLQEVLAVKQDPVGVFWALLLLCSQSKVELEQTEFYQDLRLRPIESGTLAIDLHPSIDSAAAS